MNNGEIVQFMAGMSEGNPGALAFCAELMKFGMYGLSALNTLSEIGLRGTRLYMFWNDCCGRSMETVFKAVNARNEGKLKDSDIVERVSGVRGKLFDEDELK